MAVIRRTIYDTVLDPLGQPIVGLEVTAKLVDAAFYRPDPSVSIHPVVVSTKTDENGYWSLDLIPNALLAPRGNYYILKVGEKFYYLWIPADDTSPLPLSAVLVGEHDICQTDLPGIAGVRVEGNPPLTGVVTLRQGTEITLEQDYDNRIITIHGRKYLEGTETTIEPIDPLTYRIHGRRVVGEQGIIVTPRLPFDRVVTPDYGTEVQPIAASSSAGTLDRFARIDHVHEGVHSLDAMTGDIQITPIQGILKDDDTQNNRIILFPNYGTEIQPVAASSLSGSINRFARVDHVHEGVHALDEMTGDIVIEATQGLRKVDDAVNKRIILKSTHAIYLTPEDFWTYGEIHREFFPWRTNENVPFTATHSTGEDVTEILTDNDYQTSVVVDFNNSITLKWSIRSIHAIRFYVSAVRTAGGIVVHVKDCKDNYIAYGSVNVTTPGWYEAIVRTPPHAVVANVLSGYWEEGFVDCDIAEVRLIGGLAIPALYPGARWTGGYGYQEGIIQSSCFLYAGWHYKYRAWFGCTDDASTAIVEGRLYDENGLVTVFRPKGGLGTGQEDQIIVLSGDLLTPAESKFYLIEWYLISDGTRGVPGGDPHFLGMLIEFA